MATTTTTTTIFLRKKIPSFVTETWSQEEKTTRRHAAHELLRDLNVGLFTRLKCSSYGVLTIDIISLVG